jgi:hypothetical protein
MHHQKTIGSRVHGAKFERGQTRSKFDVAVQCLQAQQCPDTFGGQIEQLLHAIHPLLSDPIVSVADNACGAAARILEAHASRLPVPQVLQELLRHLPIREDFEEAAPVASALVSLTSGPHAASVAPQMPLVLRALATCALEARADDETQACAARGLHALLTQHTGMDLQLSAEQQQRLSDLATETPA